MTDEADTTTPAPPGAPTSSGTTSGPSFSRDRLVRPRQGRYVAGVCAALARATNTDPVLWRVLIAVLGILSGVGVLFYLIGWLIIPAEGDTASPIESLLGKGRCGMAPVSIVLLGAAAVVSFAFIVNDGMRTSLLAAAVVVGAFLLIKRGGGTSSPPNQTFPPPPGPDPASAAPQAYTPPSYTPPSYSPPAPDAPATAAAPPADPVTEPIGPVPPVPPMPPMPPMPPRPPQAGGYRPPFAPHGPWASSAPTAPFPPAHAPAPVRPPKPPKPPRERSKLGRLTFFAVVMVTGLMVVLDMAGASIPVSAYFAAALVTIGLGLIVGAWLGRARGLIALGLLTAIGLGISTGVERWSGEIGNSVYRPATFAAIADRYDFTAGNATLDLRDVDFTGKKQAVTLTMKLGQIRVLLPPAVDTTADVQINGGRAMIFGHEYTGDRNDTTQHVTDLGADGEGGGTVTLTIQMDTGNVEVLR